MLLAVMILPFASQAQNLTVCDGTVNSQYVPFDGYNADGAQHNQMLYPATDLTAMNGQAITQMVFYIDPSASNGTYTAASRLGTWTVSLGETTATTLSALDNTTTLTQVYQGYFDCSTGTLTLEFDQAYVYNGGNLLVDLNHAAASWNRWYFLGVTTTENASYNSYNSSAYTFLPKCTFSYGAIPSCFKVTNLAASNATPASLTLTWTDALNSNATYSIYDMSDTSILMSNVTGTTCVVNNLTAATTYTLGVQTNCGSDNADGFTTVTCATTCYANTIFPWSEDFESFAASSSGVKLEDPCWVNEHISGSGTYFFEVYQGSSAGGNATKTLRLHDMSNGTQTKLILPQMDIPTGTTKQLSIAVYRNASGTSYTSEGVRVFASTDGEITGATELGFLYRNCAQTDGGSVSAESATGWYTYDFVIPFTGTCYIILRGESQYGSATYLDNFVIDDAPSCVSITALTAADITSNSVTLNWTDALNTGATYTVYDMSDTSVVATGITGTTYTVTSLIANTVYTFGVVADCGGGDVSDAVTVSCQTLCEAATIPYTENFDGLTTSTTAATGVHVDCWTYTMTGSSSYQAASYQPQVYYSATNANSGSYSLRLYGVSYTCLPPMAEPLNTLKLSFSAYTTGTSYKLAVGVMEGSTFIPIDTLNTTPTSTHIDYTVYFGSYTGSSRIIAFRNFNTSATTYYAYSYIDDIVVDYLPACSPVTNLAVSGATTSSITLSWEDNLNTSATYTVADNQASIASGITGTTYTVTGLNPGTQYTFHVIANCSATENGDTVSVSGYTACSTIAAADLPFSEDFEAYASGSSATIHPCWTKGTNGSTAYPYPSTSVVSGERCLYFYGYKPSSATSTNIYSYAALPQIDATLDVTSLTLGFKAKRYSTTTVYYRSIIYVGVMTDPTDATTFVAVDTINMTPLAANTIETYFVDLANYSGTGKYVAFYCPWIDTTTSYSYNYIYIDDVVLDATPTCLPVTNLTVADATSSSLTLTWVDADNSGATYTVYDMSDNSVVATGVTSTTYTATGLNANTPYTFGVKANCSATDESPMVTVNGRTSCGTETLPFTETFDATLSSDPCWRGASGVSAADVFAGTALTLGNPTNWTYTSSARDGFEGGHYYKNIYGNADAQKAWMITPAIDLTTVSSAQLSFDVALTDYNNAALPDANGDTNTSQAFMVIISTDGGQTWSANNATVWQNGTGDYTYASLASLTYQNKVIDLTPYVGNTIKIAFYTQSLWSGGDNDLHLDNISVTGTTAPQVDSIYVTLAVNDATMGTTVPAPGTHAYVAGETFTATAVPETGYHLTDWQMTLGGQVMPTGVTDLTITDVITSAYNGVTLTAVFAADADTTVGCAPVALPYTETFEDASTTVDCWTTDGPGTWNFGSYSSTGVTYEGSNYAYIRHATSGNVTKLISPVLSVSADATALQLTFAHIQKSWSGDQDEMRVYYRTSATDSWVMAAEYTTDIQNWTVENIVIPANTHQVAFEMTDSWGYGVAVDSVVFAEMTAAYCYAVTGLTATPTAYDVALTWNDANNDGATYTIYSATGDVVATGVTGNNYTVTNLTPDSPYTFGVVANCTATSASDAATVTTRTLVTCPAPTALTATITPGNGTVATLAWTAGATETAWQICLNGDSTNLIDVTTNPYTLTGLTPETPYTAMVRANCDVNDQSAWSNTVNFTPTNAYIITVNDGATTNSYVPIYGTWADDITKSQFIIPAADLAAMQYGAINKLTFYASQASVSWGAAEFNVYLTETTDNTISELGDYTTMAQVYAGTLSINNNIMEVNLTNPYLYMGGNLKVGFLQTVSGSWSSSSWYGVSATGASMGGYGSSISQRDFLPKTTIAYTPGTAPSCLPVTGLTASDVTATGATLTWNGDAASYNVYAINGTDTTLVQNVATTTITLTGLTAMTHYTYGVTAVCTNDESIMMSTTFTTACAAVAIPFTEGFEGNSNTLACWSVYATSTNTGIVTSATQYAHTGDGVFAFSYSTNPPQFLISPELSGTGSQLQVEFDYRIMSSTYPESFVVGYSTTTADTSAFTWGTEQTNLVNETYAHYTEVLNASGIKYVAVKYTANDMYFLFIDDVVIRDVPACAAVTNLTVDSVTMTSVSLSWTDANNTGATYTVYNDSTVVATGLTVTNYTVTGLTAATTYTFGVVANCSATEAGDMVTIVASTACGDITTLPYYEGFENGFGCWSTVNGSADGQPWNVQASFDNGAVTPHTGSYMAASWSWNNAAYHADAWLISPKFVLPATLPAGEELTLSWWERTNSSYPDSYSVVLSTTTNDTAAFTTVLRPYDEAEGSWTLQSVDLTAYAGQSIYIAFHHMDYDENYLLIDDIELSLNAPVVPADTLTITFAVNDATMGTTTPAPGTYTYVSGDTISFTATANSGYHFDYWLLTTMGETDTFSVSSYFFEADDLLVDGIDNLVMQAVFSAGTPDSIAVTYAVNDATMGTTNPAPGVHYYYVNDMVSVTATPNAGYMLDYWVMEMYVGAQLYMTDTADAEDNPLLITAVDQQYVDYNVTFTVTAYFAADTTPVTMYNVTLGVNDTTMGSVSPAGTTQAAAGSNFIATATANSGYHFVAWLSQTGDTVSHINIYSFTVNSDVILMAVFAENDSSVNYYTVSVAYDNSKGRIDGEGEYEEGSSVSLIAYPFENYEFVAWLDENMDTLSTNTAYMIVNLQSNRALTAIFRPKNSINDVEADNVTVYSVDNRIVVRGAEGRQVFLFDVNGRMLSREASAAENVEFRVNNSGVYLVKVGNAAAKRVVVLR